MTDPKNYTESPENQTEMHQQEFQPSPAQPDYKEQYIRANADFQNYKRRIEKERIEWTQVMQGDVLEKMLPFVDDLERAIQASENSAPEGSTAWIEGFKLILKNLKKKLSELGIEEISTKELFNPEFHEALMQVESAEHSTGQIVQELSKGYTFKGKVLKHARVSVAK